MTVGAATEMDRQLLENVREQVEASVTVKQRFLAEDHLLEQVGRLAQSCLGALRANGKVIFAGNGGSFADAQHLSAEFTSRFLFDRAPLASLALGTNSSAMSAIGNDYGYEQVFARELASIARPNDIFIPISTSGESPNLLKAVEVATGLGVLTVGLTGERNGRLTKLCECICVPSRETARIQEVHILIGHIVCGLVETAYFRDKGQG